MNAEHTPRKKTETWTEDEEGITILQETGECLYRLNETASLIWKLTDGKRSVQDIVSEIKACYIQTPPDDELSKIVDNTLNQLENLDVIEWV
jgi:hypothetical protein